MLCDFLSQTYSGMFMVIGIYSKLYLFSALLKKVMSDLGYNTLCFFQILSVLVYKALCLVSSLFHPWV